MKVCNIASIVGACLIFASSAHAAVTVYSNDFDGSEAFGAGVAGGLSGITTTTATPAGYAGTGIFSGSMLHNATFLTVGSDAGRTTLTLSGLPTHDLIDVNFALAIIDSWDSTNGSPAPDYFNVAIDGVVVFKPTFNNASGTNLYPDPDATFVASGALGFNSGFYFNADRAYDSSSDSALLVAHSASTVVIELFASGAGWQGGVDESWGIDNLSVEAISTIPVPAAIWFFGAGIFALYSRRTRSA